MSSESELAEWAKDPSAWGEPVAVLRGAEAAHFGRDVLERAGVEVEHFESTELVALS